MRRGGQEGWMSEQEKLFRHWFVLGMILQLLCMSLSVHLGKSVFYSDEQNQVYGWITSEEPSTSSSWLYPETRYLFQR